jgi:hypothetical protein
MEKKSNRLLGVARLAMKLGREHMSDYGAVTSRKDFTQRQLMACLVLRAYLKTTYRGVIEILETSEALRTELGMKEKLPHYSTLAKFCERSAVIYTLLGSCRRLGLSPLDSLKDLFTRLPATKISQIKKFTPAAWAKAKDELFAQAV